VVARLSLVLCAVRDGIADVLTLSLNVSDVLYAVAVFMLLAALDGALVAVVDVVDLASLGLMLSAGLFFVLADTEGLAVNALVKLALLCLFCVVLTLLTAGGDVL
jgi:hypothetical protein